MLSNFCNGVNVEKEIEIIKEIKIQDDEVYENKEDIGESKEDL